MMHGVIFVSGAVSASGTDMSSPQAAIRSSSSLRFTTVPRSRMGSASDSDASFAVSIADRTPSVSLCSESVGLFRGASDVSVSSTSSESVELEESDACDDCVQTVGV